MNRIDSPQRQRFAMLFVRVVVLVLSVGLVHEA
jgi:hypothetical protein